MGVWALSFWSVGAIAIGAAAPPDPALLTRYRAGAGAEIGWPQVEAGCGVVAGCPDLGRGDAQILCRATEAGGWEGLGPESVRQVGAAAAAAPECARAREISLKLEVHPCAEQGGCAEVQVWQLGAHPAQSGLRIAWALAPGAALALSPIPGSPDRARVWLLPGANSGEGRVIVRVTVGVYGGEASAEREISVALDQAGVVGVPPEPVWISSAAVERDLPAVMGEVTAALLLEARRELEDWALRQLAARVCAQAALLPESCEALSASRAGLLARSDAALLELRASLSLDIGRLPIRLAEASLREGATDGALVLAAVARGAELEREGISATGALLGWAAALQGPPRGDQPAAAALYGGARWLRVMAERGRVRVPATDVQRAHAWRAALLADTAEGRPWSAAEAQVRAAEVETFAAALPPSPDMPSILGRVQAVARLWSSGLEAEGRLQAAELLARALMGADPRGTLRAAQRLQPAEALSLLLDGGIYVVEAKEPKQIAEALSLWAMPRGSSELKRAPQRLGVGLNAYVGGGLGRDVPVGDRDSAVGSLWLTMPVGVEAGRASPFGYVGVFASALDLGVLWQVRLGVGEEVAASHAVTQLFAPGIYGVYGLSGMPISVGAGVALVSDRRSAEGGTYVQNVRRAGAFVAVDVPVYRLRWYPGGAAAEREARSSAGAAGGGL